MNKIFKVIWDVASQQFVVTSELGKAKGKTKSVKSAKTAIALAVATAGTMTSTQAMAATAATLYNDGQTIISGSGVPNGGSVPINYQVYVETRPSNVNGGGSVMLGETATVADGMRNGVSIGANTIINDAPATYGTDPAIGGVAIGDNVVSKSQSVAIGSGVTSNGKMNVVIGNQVKSMGEQDVVIGNGAASNRALADSYNIVIGRAANATEDASGAIAMGYEAKAGAGFASAIGRAATATGTESQAWGTNANATKQGAIAIGRKSTADGLYSIAMGADLPGGGNTTAAAQSSIALGNGAQITNASANSAIAIGQEAKSDYNSAIALGIQANATGGNYAMALGGQSTANGSASIAAGLRSSANAVRAIAIGREANANGTSSIAAGAGATATSAATNGIAYGTSAGVTAENAVAIGATAFANNAGAVALGNASTTRAATSENTATVGDVTYSGFAGNAPSSVVSVGSAGAERQLVNVAAGNISSTSTDAINGSQLYAVADKLGGQVFNSSYFHVNNISNAGTGNNTTNLGNITDAAGATGAYSVTAGVNATAVSNNTISIGHNAATGMTRLGVSGLPSGENAIAIGLNATAESKDSIAIGRDAKVVFTETDTNVFTNPLRGTVIGAEAMVAAQNATAIGFNAVAGSDYDYGNVTSVGAYSRAEATNAVAFGATANATGQGSSAIGTAATTNGSQSIALGFQSSVTGDYGSALGVMSDAVRMGTATGTGAQAVAEGATATGYNAIANATNATALGGRAKATHEGAVALGNHSTTAAAVGTVNATVANVTYGDFAGTTPKSVVSIGQEGQERQLINVAAGRISETSTDAINGSQLYFVYQQAAKPLTFTANTNADTDAELLDKQYAAADGTQQQLGEKIAIIGAATGTALTRNTDAVVSGDYSAKNIQTVVSNGEVQIQMAENPIFDSVQFGDTSGPKITNDGTNIKVGSSTDAPVKITNVANGTNPNDAVNLSQLNATSVSVVAGNNTHVTAKPSANGGTTYTIDAEKTVVTTGTGLTVSSTPGANNVTTYNVALDKATQDQIAKEETVSTGTPALVTVTTNATKNSTGGNDFVVNITKGTFNGATTEGSLHTEGTTNGVATVADVIAAVNAIGFNVTSGGNKADGDEAEATLINPGEEITYSAGKNLTVKRVDNEFTFATADDVTFNNVTATNLNVSGNTTVNNFEVKPNSVVNMGGNTITNVANGTNANDAVNLSQLNATKVTVLEGKNTNVTSAPNATTGGTDYTVNAVDTSASTSLDAASSKYLTVAANGTTEVGNATVTDYKVGLSTEAINKLDNAIIAVEDTATVNMTVTDGTLKADVITNNGAGTTVNTTAGGVSFDIKTDGTTVKVGDNNALTVVTGNTTVNTNGTVGVAPGSNATDVATIGDITKTINQGYWTTKVNGTDVDQVNFGDAVNFVNGTGTVARANGTNITFDVNLKSANNTIAISNNTDGSVNLDVNTTALTQPITANTDGKAELSPVNGVTDSNKLVTAGDVVNTINNVSTFVTVDKDGGSIIGTATKSPVKAGDTVTFKAGAGTAVAQNGNSITYSVDFTNAATVDGTGNVAIDSTNGTKVINASDVVTLINNAGWNVEGSTTGTGTSTGTLETNLVTSGDTVTLRAGDNLNLDQEQNVFTFALQDDITVNNITTSNLTATGNTTVNNFEVKPNSVVNMGGNTITNVANGTNATDAVNLSQLNATKVTVQEGKNTNVTSTVNATTGGTDYTVNAVDTSASTSVDTASAKYLTVAANGTTEVGNATVTDYKVGLSTEAINKLDNAIIAVEDTATVNMTVTDGTLKADVITNNGAGTTVNTTAGGVSFDIKTDGTTVKVGDNNALTVVTGGTEATTSGKAAVTTGSNATDVATIGDLVDTINSVGWFTNSTNAGGNTTGTAADTKITAGKAVNFEAGTNLKVEQKVVDGNVTYTYSTADDVTFNNITASNLTVGPVTITSDGIDAGNTTITNVAPGTNGTDAVNLDQLNASTAANAWKITGNNNDAAATTVGNQTVSFNNGTGTTAVVDGTNVTYNINTDGTTVKVGTDGNLTVVTGGLTNNADGNVTVPAGETGSSLVNQTTVANAINNSGWKLAADGTAGTELINPSETVTFIAGTNLEVTRDGANITYKTADDVTFNNITTSNLTANGNTTVNNFEVAPNSVVNMGGNTITNVAPGTNGTDAVNLNQLNASTAANAWKITGNNDDAAATTVGNQTVSFNNGTGTTAVVDGTNVTYNINTDGTTVKVGDNGNLTVVTGNTTVTDGKAGVATDSKGSDVATIGDIVNTINNVSWNVFQDSTAQTDPTKRDAVTAGDNIVFKAGTNTTVNVSSNGKTTDITYDVDFSKIPTTELVVDAGKVQLPNTVEGAKFVNATTITNAINNSGWKTVLTNGNTEIINPGDTVNYVNGTGTAANVTKVGDVVNVAYDVKVDGTTIKVGQDGNLTVDVNSLPSTKLVNGNNTVVKGSGTTDDPYNVNVITGGTTVNSNGTVAIAGGANTTDVATIGDITKTINQGFWTTQVNGKNVDQVNFGDAVNFVNGTGTVARADGTNITFDVNLKSNDGSVVITNNTDGSLNLAVNVSSLPQSTKLENGTNTVVTGTGSAEDPYKVNVEGDLTNITSIANGDTKVTLGNQTVDVGGSTISNVKAGEKDDDAVNVSQLNETNQGWTITTSGNTETEGVSSQVKLGKSAKPAEKTVTISGGKNIKVKQEGNTVSVATTDTPTFETVTVGGDKGVTMSSTTATDGVKELSVGTAEAPTRITNVAPGVKDTDAVNVSQLKQVQGNVNAVNKKVDKLDKRVRGIGASSAAASSLPQVYIPGKSMVAAAAGGYGGASAVAVGYSRASDNGKLILKLQGTANSQGHMSGGVGVGYQW